MLQYDKKSCWEPSLPDKLSVLSNGFSKKSQYGNTYDRSHNKTDKTALRVPADDVGFPQFNMSRIVSRQW